MDFWQYQVVTEVTHIRSLVSEVLQFTFCFRKTKVWGFFTTWLYFINLQTSLFTFIKKTKVYNKISKYKILYIKQTCNLINHDLTPHELLLALWWWRMSPGWALFGFTFGRFFLFLFSFRCFFVATRRTVTAFSLNYFFFLFFSVFLLFLLLFLFCRCLLTFLFFYYKKKSTTSFHNTYSTYIWYLTNCLKWSFIFAAFRTSWGYIQNEILLRFKFNKISTLIRHMSHVAAFATSAAGGVSLFCQRFAP